MTKVRAYRIDTVDDVQRGHYCFVAAQSKREAREVFAAWLSGGGYRIQTITGPFEKDPRVVMNG